MSEEKECIICRNEAKWEVIHPALENPYYLCVECREETDRDYNP